MIYFIVLLLLIPAIYFFDYRKNRQGSLAAYLLFYILAVGVAGLRYRIGGDSIGYEVAYERFPTLLNIWNFNFSSTRFEPGYIVFSCIPRTFSPDFTLFQFFHALVVNGVIFWFIAKNTRNKYIGILLYFICNYLNLNTEVLRESLAVCCFLIAWPFFRDGKWLRYYLFTLLACLFHISALVTLLLPLTVIPGIRELFRLGKRIIIIYTLIFIFAYLLQRKFFNVIELLSSGSTLEERAQSYVKSSYGGTVLNIFGMTETLFRSVIFPLVALYYRKLQSKSLSLKSSGRREVSRMEPMIITGTYFTIVSLVIFILGRYNNYFSMFNYVIIASCFFTAVKVKRKKYKLQAASWVILLVIFLGLNFKGYFAGTYGSSTNKRYMLYYPYASRLDPKEDYHREEILRYAHHIK